MSGTVEWRNRDGRCGGFDGGARHTSAASRIRHPEAGADDGGFGHYIARLFRSGGGFISCAQSCGLATRGSATQGVSMKRDLLEQAYAAMRHDMRKTVLTMFGMAGALPRWFFCLLMAKALPAPSKPFLKASAPLPSGFSRGALRSRLAETRPECRSALPMTM